MLNWLLTLEEAVMLQTISRLLPELPLFLMTAVATHLVMSFAQTLMHYKLGHHPMGLGDSITSSTRIKFSVHTGQEP
jgi:hypothetical protein